MRFAHATTANLSFADALNDATTKDSNSWEEMISGRRSVTITTDVLVDFDDVSGAQSFEGVNTVALGQAPTAFTFVRPSTGLSTGDFLGWSGEAFIESFDINTTSDEIVTASVSLKVTGPLTPEVVS